VTHDYKRNGRATLIAALNALDGKVISRVTGIKNWLRFFKVGRRCHARSQATASDRGHSRPTNIPLSNAS